MTGSTSATAVVCTSREALAADEIDLLPLEDDDVLVATTYSGVSTGTDRWVMQGRYTWNETGFPFVPGYQRSGKVVAVGSAVTDLAVGDAVVALKSRGFRSVASKWGSHVSLAASARDQVYSAAGIDPRASALVVSAQVGVNAASRIVADARSRVLVIGDGIIGASGALASAARGFDVVLAGRHSDRRSVIERAGIRTVDAGDSAALRGVTADAIIDTAQNDQSFDYALAALPERNGQLVYSGHSPAGVETWASMAELQKREITAHFVSGWTAERIEATLALMRAGDMPMERLIGAEATAGTAASLLESVRDGTTRDLASVIRWGMDA
jgi:2-desacetyl-2-hydroxyethyl bacteriochlorophyllide A dehydrogenase